MRNIGGITNLLVFIFSLAGGIGVYVKRPKELLNRIFLFMMVSIACWSFVNFQCDMASNLEEYIFWNEFDIFWYLTVTSLLHFSLVYSENRLIKKQPTHILLYLFAIILLLLDLFVIVKTGIINDNGEFRIRYYDISRVLRYTFMMICSLMSVLSMVFLFMYYRSDKCSKKRETLIVWLGLLLGVVIAITDEMILPFLGGTRISFIGTSPYLVTYIFVAYGVIKYDILADSSERLKKTMGNVSPEDKKEINRAYAEQKELLRKIIYYGSTAIFVKDREGRYILVNDQFHKTIGVTEDIIGKTDFDIFPRHVAEINRLRDLEVINRKEVLKSEDIHKGEGASTYVIITRFPLYNHKNDVFALGGVLTDITEQKKNQIRLQEALKEAEFLFNDTAIGLALIKNVRLFTQVNKRFEDTFGYTSEEIQGKDVTTVFAHQQSFERFKDENLEKIEGGEIVETIVRLKCKDDSLIWCKLFIKALHPPRTEEGIITAFEDITKEKQLEEFHHNVEQIMHHDLKNTLNSIIGMPSIMLDDENLTEDQRENLQLIMDSGEMMLNQITSTLNVYKIEEGSYRYVPETVDLMDTVQKVLHYYINNLGSIGVGYRLIFNNSEINHYPVLEILGDTSLLFIMISNIFKNAMEASGRGDIITISLTDCAKEIQLSIHNQKSIPENIRPRFFEKFVTEGKMNGTGIGTYSAKLMAGVMGAIIEFSTGETIGTEIIITFKKEQE